MRCRGHPPGRCPAQAETALVQAANSATRLLEAAAGADTEARLVELGITGLSQLPDERIAAIRNSHGQTPDAIAVVSAFPLAGDQRQRLEQALLTPTRSGDTATF